MKVPLYCTERKKKAKRLHEGVTMNYCEILIETI